MSDGTRIKHRQMQFSDFLIDLALRVSNDCLRTVRVMTPMVATSALEDLRNQIARIEACALLHGKSSDNKFTRRIVRHCVSLDNMLFDQLQSRYRGDTVADLLKRVRKKKTRRALNRYSKLLVSTPTELDIAPCQEQIVAISDAWREVPLRRSSRTENSSEEKVGQHHAKSIDAYKRSYRKGKKLGKIVLANGQPKQHLTWYKRVRALRLQLEVMRAALGEENKAIRWYLEKLQQNLSELIALDDFESYAERLSHNSESRLSNKDLLRLGSVCLSRRETLKRRSAKLYQGIYGQKVKVFGQVIARDLDQLNLDNIVLLPKPASKLPVKNAK